MNNFFDFGEHANCLEGGAAQVEEVLLNPYRRAPKYLLPDADKLFFQICSGGGGVEHGRPSLWWFRWHRAGQLFLQEIGSNSL